MLIQGPTASVSITSSDAAYTINWGDGATSTATGTGPKSYSHTYANSNNYLVQVLNCQNVSKCTTESALIAYWSVGNSQVKDLVFSNKSTLRAVGADIFKNDSQRSSFLNVFYNCTNLQSLPVGIFENCSNATTFENAFVRSGIKSLPSGLFSGCPLIVNFTQAFLECSRLSFIPEGLFDITSKATSFNSTFKLCSSLSTVPSNLFKKCTLVVDFQNCFNSCLSIVSLLPEIWRTHYKVNGAGCFTQCSMSPNYGSVPESWGGNTGVPAWNPGAMINSRILAEGGTCFYQDPVSRFALETELLGGTDPRLSFYGCKFNQDGSIAKLYSIDETFDSTRIDSNLVIINNKLSTPSNGVNGKIWWDTPM